MKKRIILIALFSALVVIIAGGAALIIMNNNQVNAYNAQDHVVNVNDCITDAKKLKEAFPAFGNIQSCFWDSGIMHKDTFFESLINIGPSQYWLNGYAVLDQKSIEKLLNDYSWGSDADNTYGHFKEIVGQINADKEFDWKQSEDFNTSFGGYFGNFYLDENNGIIVFDLARD